MLAPQVQNKATFVDHRHVHSDYLAWMIILENKQGAEDTIRNYDHQCGQLSQPQVTLESRRKHPSQQVVRNSDLANQ